MGAGTDLEADACPTTVVWDMAVGEDANICQCDALSSASLLGQMLEQSSKMTRVDSWVDAMRFRGLLAA